MHGATQLDHLAIAADDVTELFPRYAGDLAGGWVGMRPEAGFSFAQVRFGNGPRLELLEPSAGDDGDRGLWRFGDHENPGPHHLTFSVGDLHAKVEALADAGFHPAQVSYDDPEWFEAVLAPDEATGVLVQLAEVHGGTPITPVPDGVAVPPRRVAHAAHLDWIGHAVASLDEGRRLFGDILDGAENSDGVQEDPMLGAQWVEFEWPENGRIRLFAPLDETSPLGPWLDGRRGRIHHIKLSVEHPETIADAVDQGDGTWEIPGERNFGVRLLLTSRERMKQEAADDQRATGVDLHGADALLIPGA